MSQEVASLAGAARLFGDLLLHELTPESLRALREPGPSELLRSVGVDVPVGADATPEFLDELAAQYHAALLAPTGGGAPPVASLWIEGRYEGHIVARIRELAKSAALDFGPEAARGAPVDHLGALLHLWAASVERAPWVSDELAKEHLGWTNAPLAQMEKRGGFYGSVATATADLVRLLRSTTVDS
ncbi:Chaperone protein TorD [Planctomycetes bacterium Poly30]|uniref:Chaperone protein TorD n=1 Tax=Saltatorellus ferox TaxID=2528018 RepID=A0A518EXL0_9BACT|nr:Chaperone protein TorD [Planctomycetes bacterium Poly30]